MSTEPTPFNEPSNVLTAEQYDWFQRFVAATSKDEDEN